MLDRLVPAPIRPVALWKTIVAPLRRAIILGELRAGTRLEEAALAQKFKVSRIPVRAALTRLEHEGLARIEARRGAYVVGMSDGDVHDVYEIRRFLEAVAIRRVAGLADAEIPDQLGTLASQMDALVRHNERQAFARHGVEFHRQIVAFSGSPPLLAVWDPIGGLITTILGITNSLHPDIKQTLISHHVMVDSVARHDPDQTVHLLRAHLEFGERVMLDALRQVSVNK